MAITYTVCRETVGTVRQSQNGQFEDLVDSNATIIYQVDVDDPADQNFDPREIDEFDVLSAPDLPEVNTSTYETTSGLVVPYLTCVGVDVVRDEQVRSRFIVTTTWKTNAQEVQGALPPPQSIDDLTPQVDVQLGEEELVRYSDKDDFDCLTPTKNLYDTPFVERLATQIRRVTQYETFLSYDTMESRKLKVSSDDYAGKVSGSWIMTQVEGKTVKVRLASGIATVAQVTYTMESTNKPGLWEDERALIDTHYYDQDNNDEKTAFTDEQLKTYVIGRVDVIGHIVPPGQPMNYDQFRMQDTQAFNGFLKA